MPIVTTNKNVTDDRWGNIRMEALSLIEQTKAKICEAVADAAPETSQAVIDQFVNDPLAKKVWEKMDHEMRNPDAQTLQKIKEGCAWSFRRFLYTYQSAAGVPYLIQPVRVCIHQQPCRYLLSGVNQRPCCVYGDTPQPIFDMDGCPQQAWRLFAPAITPENQKI